MTVAIRWLGRTGRPKGVVKILTILAILVFAPQQASAQDSLEKPQGPVVLTVDGNISVTNMDGKAVFDMAMLKAMSTHVITTGTPWADSQQTFEGPLLRDIIEAVGGTGTKIKASAINDYFVEIPMEDVIEIDTILAHTLNGKPMRIRDKGPLWVIYPWDDQPALKNEKYYSRSIWQTKQLTIR